MQDPSGNTFAESPVHDVFSDHFEISGHSDKIAAPLPRNVPDALFVCQFSHLMYSLVVSRDCFVVSHMVLFITSAKD